MSTFPNPDTQFKAGNPGGPGRPPTRRITDRLRERLDDPAEIDAVIDAWLDAAKSGDLVAIREMLNRIEGKVKDQVEHEGTVTVRVEYADVEPDDHAPEAPPGAAGDTPVDCPV